MSTATLRLPKLYAILDAESSGSRQELLGFGKALVAAGVTLVQYRDKNGNTRAILGAGRDLKRTLGPKARLIMNDRTDLCLAAGFDGVHLGQDDLAAVGARRVVGKDKLIGCSTHNVEQAIAAEATDADYVAIGPIFGTRSKVKPDPVVGIAGLEEVRRHVNKPLVAIGGITRENCAEVMAAGADSVAVISDLIDSSGKDSVAKRVEDFFRRLE
jgi:thiamine-phosphate pyrophosphorylase